METSSYPLDSKSPFLPHWVVLSAGTAIGLLFILIGGYWFLQASAPSSTDLKASPFDPQRTISVDIQGKVRSPGVQTHTVSFSTKLRVGDVIASAGGVLQDANKDFMAKNINLAQEVQDGDKIYIPAADEPTPNQEKSMGKVSINSSSIQELEALTGIGKTRAQRIVDSRPYRALDELVEKAQIPLSVLEKIREEISL